MKRLLALLTVVLFSGFMMAQNTSTVDQTGNLQVASVTQTGNNTSDIDQVTDLITGGKQTATVIQVGTLNSSIIDQNNTGGTQVVPNDAYINQIGTSNISLQTTRSYGNQDINLWGLQNGVENTLTQATIGGYTSSFVANQNGDLNIATQIGIGVTTNTAKILQNGLSNSATQELFGSNNGYYGGIYSNERIIIDQFGNNNAATQNFTGIGSSHGNTADIHQIGDYNSGVQIGNGRNIYAEFSQDGDNNIATSDQSGEAQQAFVSQDGDDNEGNIFQNGNLNYGSISQEGNYNYGDISSTGNSNIANINQTGDSNTATITQQ